MTTMDTSPKVSDPSDRFQLRNMGELQHPASCAVCGTGSCDAGFVDIGVYFEYEGYVYLCIPCLTQAAETGGMLSIEQSQYLRNQNNELVAENKSLQERMDKALERLGHYDALLNGAASSSTNDDADSDSSVSEVSSETTERDANSDESVNRQSSVGRKGQESESAKPVKGKRPSNSVRDAGSDINL